MHEWIRVASIAEIPANRLTVWQTEEGEVLIYHSSDRYFVYPNRCTHQNVPLSDGYLVGDALICRLHGAKFDLKTGTCLRAPARSNLCAYSVAVWDGSLFICPTQTNENSGYPEPMTIPSYRNAQVTGNGF